MRMESESDRKARERAEEAVRVALAFERDRLTRQLFGLPAKPSITAPAPAISATDLEETLQHVRPVLYYATNDALPLGRVLHAPERPGWPEVVFCHPDDLAELRAQLPWLSLRPFREWMPTAEDIQAAFQEAIAALGVEKSEATARSESGSDGAGGNA